jgi:uncharacterized protein with PIN domain
MGSVFIRFYAELGDLLSPERRGREFQHPFPAGGAVKDLIEGLGVPHTEVDLILVDGRSVDFSCPVGNGEHVSVYPVFEALDVGPVTRVRALPLRRVWFAADVHLGKLAGYLRLAGFDTLYRNDWSDEDLVDSALREHRIILTRDRGVLMRSAVTHGHLVRHVSPREQLLEILERFDLWRSLRPLTRCSLCNALVESVDKAEVVQLVPARTARYYEEFWRCVGCGQIYWKGAHYRSLERLLAGERSVPSAP